MDNTLVKGKKYSGCYVALKDFGDNEVITDGKDPDELFRKAAQKGCKDPVILFVPEKDMVRIY